ncbi:hypothetical protein ACIGW4_05140 [Streptomyces sp. NPDC053513]|uniref:hypothetical protein n=1 Tax=unclassified Streptomyces TaxID=2593676 RepID=UPI0037D2BB2C
MEFRYGTGQEQGQGQWSQGSDPEATEVIPRFPHPVPAGASAALPDEVTSTRPLPRIDDSHPPVSGPARPRRAPARAAVAGAVLLACAGAGLSVGGLLSGREEAVPEAAADEENVKAAPSEARQRAGQVREVAATASPSGPPTRTAPVRTATSRRASRTGRTAPSGR